MELEHQIEDAVRESLYPNAEVLAHIEPFEGQAPMDENNSNSFLIK